MPDTNSILQNTLEQEEWHDVVGYEGYYRVSTLGRIQSLLDRHGHSRIHLIQLALDPDGRWTFTACKDGRRRTLRVYVLVAAAFLGPRPKGNHVNHLS